MPEQEAHLDVNNQASTRQRTRVLLKTRQTYESRVIFSVDVDQPCSLVFSPVLLTRLRWLVWTRWLHWEAELGGGGGGTDEHLDGQRQWTPSDLTGGLKIKRLCGGVGGR